MREWFSVQCVRCAKWWKVPRALDRESYLCPSCRMVHFPEARGEA